MARQYSITTAKCVFIKSYVINDHVGILKDAVQLCFRECYYSINAINPWHFCVFSMCSQDYYSIIMQKTSNILDPALSPEARQAVESRPGGAGGLMSSTVCWFLC